jgi:radical SAM superfamily enzyme YgiQ (UPF0313 family)
MKLDLLLASIPPNYINEPSLAPALLKAAVQQYGFTCRTLDFSLHLYQNIFENNYQEYLNWTDMFGEGRDFDKATTQQLCLIDKAMDEFIKLIDKFQPKFVGISFFSWWQQKFGYLLCKRLRQQCPEVKIIIGGAGVSVTPFELQTMINLSTWDRNNSFGAYMLKSKLTDHVIYNDGEQALVQVLQLTHTNSDQPNEQEFDYEFTPNFDDYELDSYLYLNNEKKLLVQGSKGCIRKCTFCSEHKTHSRYYYKTGDKIAEELIILSNKYKVFNFQFTDSLVNGNLKEFKKFITRLADYNLSNTTNAIKWCGTYICRSKNNFTDEDFKLIKQSGAHGITIGAETGSNQVLKAMKKNTTVEDLEWEIAQFQKHGIDCMLLMMIGFYTETWEDFLQTLQMLKRLQKYFVSRTISYTRLGTTLLVSPISPIWKSIDVDDFELDTKNLFNWKYKPNPTLDGQERLRRRVIAQEFCDQLGIPVTFAREDLLTVESMYNNTSDRISLADH